ncbi:MAG: hypothetical protein A3J66_02750 [Candidatus Magasanikbacteria bacterium RIFCSPHIGHO2_02_FULL_47_14]|uniref:PD-(D/E)XK endonuclease-like domain-containing protein n=1 Tax=Candidatus Magasanikbacteria bacterium RIFCSPHIGHO2_02_FULL_47_14 TaxID=1798680 RepID=A0A1F6M8J8_9BACT|nr:MAG: hypothetical protein A3J66_02750 [Candidatus Magasanikbacteria bacterium RIFCSPHIGHO2_02_FULL_47_14]
MPDKFAATWVSHSSISDYLTCPRSYFLKNIYKDPVTNRKMKIMNPALALGQAVHETLEALSSLKTEDRFRTPLPERYAAAWKKISGKRGGFVDEQTEYRYRRRGEEMIARVFNHPGPIANRAVKIQDDLPHFWLSEEEEIILCGKIDWLEYLPEEEAVHIIDFKTGKNYENEGSLQLPIYLLLVHNCQKWPVKKASYWYLDSSDFLTDKTLPAIAEAEQQVLHVARKIKLARLNKQFTCPSGSEECHACAPFEQVLQKKAEWVDQDDFGADVYILPSDSNRTGTTIAEESLIL